MSDNQKIVKGARRRAARRRAWFRGLSFGAGVLVTLLVAFVFFRGQWDVTTSSQSVAPTPTALLNSVAPTAVTTPTAQVTERPANTPAPTLEPEEPVIIDTTTLEPFSKSSVVSTSDDQEFSVKLNVDDRIEMKVGETGQLKAKLDPSDPSAVLVWKSSDESVIKVNEKGKVKAVGTGTATVSLWINDNEESSADVEIRVGKKQSGTVYVWIPRTGKKYHSDAHCSNMKNPRKVTKDYAIDHNYGECSKCW